MYKPKDVTSTANESTEGLTMTAAKKSLPFEEACIGTCGYEEKLAYINQSTVAVSQEDFDNLERELSTERPIGQALRELCTLKAPWDK